MPPYVSAMMTIRQVFLAALRSLLRGKSFIQALLACWIGPSGLRGGSTAAAEQVSSVRRSVEAFLCEAEEQLLRPIQGDGLRLFSVGLKRQFRDWLVTNPACMLPSYNHKLPNGRECGQHLTLDVGGSTLRVALVELRSREARGAESGIISMKSFKITPDIKRLEGRAFFDWMATRVLDTISNSIRHTYSPENPVPLGLAWSFPIEYVSGNTSYKSSLPLSGQRIS